MKEENSNPVSISTFWPSNAVSWLELILKVILISASLSAIYQYFDVKQDNRIKKTMEFLDRFNNGQILKAKLRNN